MPREPEPETFTDEDRALGRAMHNLRKRKGMTQPQAAENMGVPVQNWSRWERGDHKPRRDRLPDVARALGVTLDELMAERAGVLGGFASAAASPFRAGLTGVYGLAAGAGERIAVAAGSEIRWVPTHPAQTGYKRTGAAEVVGMSMYPRYKPRELAYFVFDLPPGPGDDVVVEMNDGSALIKEFVRIRDGKVWLKEWHPEEREFPIELASVKAMHAAVR
jgi:transcriptional regulator with XRE-family HTH domain